MNGLPSTARMIGIAGCLLLATATAEAGLSQSKISSPGGFIQVGATDIDTSFGSGFVPGQDLEGWFNTPSADFNEEAFSGFGSLTRSASFTSGTITNRAWGTVSFDQPHNPQDPAQIKIQVCNTNGPSSGMFPGGRFNGGFKDTLTIWATDPSLNGQPGYACFDFDVSGEVTASGVAGLAYLLTSAYQNGAELAKNSLWSPGLSDPYSTDRQRAYWMVETDSVTPDASHTIDSTVTISVPLVFGQPFEFGFYAYGLASTRNLADPTGGSKALTSFEHTLSYSGIAGVYSGLDPVHDRVTGYTITSLSGWNWTVAGVPEPSTVLLLALGGLLLRWKRRA